MPVFFIHSRDLQTGNQIRLTAPDLIRHLRDALRIRAGEELRFVDENRKGYRARLIGPSEGGGLLFDVLEVLSPPPPSPLFLHLAQGLAKGEKMEVILQKATELGVDRITPVLSRRCVVRWKEERGDDRLLRWRRIALEAAQQSERRTVPEIDPPQIFETLMAHPPEWDLGMILDEEETAQRLTPLLHRLGESRQPEPTRPLRCLLLVGPEGGWAPEEISLARGAGLTPVSLGERILRTETAGPAVLAILQYALGEMG
ncbi:MAG: 16S rRNA (uracil(1498)-N(3))-methyltransferase [Nitrospirae bacterium]|nr:16S rRNA (uracil(1498)-N(3))-methyltransferase [Nitrospirota bacterium]